MVFVGLTNLNSVNGGGRLFPYGDLFLTESRSLGYHGGGGQEKKNSLQFVVYTLTGIIPHDKVRQLLAPEVTTWCCTFDLRR